ncbi:hypothetical protein Tco_0674013 [Tanacetum coccineum]
MAQENNREGGSMQRPPLLEPEAFCFWKTRFETYVSSKDLVVGVITIKEATDLAKLPIDELISNLKVHEMALENDDEFSKNKKNKVKSLALKGKITTNEARDDSYYQEDSDVEKIEKALKDVVEVVMIRKSLVTTLEEKKGVLIVAGKNQFIGDCPKAKENKAFVGGAWSDSEDGDQVDKDTTCLMALKS